MDKLRQLYFDYVDTFKVDGKLPPMMELKRIHTSFVGSEVKSIAEGHKWVYYLSDGLQRRLSPHRQRMTGDTSSHQHSGRQRLKLTPSLTAKISSSLSCIFIDL